MMTHKDFVAIAGAFVAAVADIRAKEPPMSIVDLCDGVEYAVDHVADVLARSNPRFNRARFLAAAKGAPLTGHDAGAS